jgi:hypothetical protein
MMNSLGSGYMKPSRNTTSKILKSFPKDEEFDSLTRYQKGFWYERFSQILLETNNIVFCGNPLSFEEWKKGQIEGYDFKVKFPNGKTVKVECKMLLGPIYPSWFYKDWLPRDADIYITNNVYAVPYKCRKILRERGKKLLSTTEFIMYVQKRIRGNKYSYLNISNSTSRYYLSDKKQMLVLEINHLVTKPRESTLDSALKKSGDSQSQIAECWKGHIESKAEGMPASLSQSDLESLNSIPQVGVDASA